MLCWTEEGDRDEGAAGCEVGVRGGLERPGEFAEVALVFCDLRRRIRP